MAGGRRDCSGEPPPSSSSQQGFPQRILRVCSDFPYILSVCIIVAMRIAGFLWCRLTAASTDTPVVAYREKLRVQGGATHVSAYRLIGVRR